MLKKIKEMEDNIHLNIEILESIMSMEGGSSDTIVSVTYPFTTKGIIPKLLQNIDDDYKCKIFYEVKVKDVLESETFGIKELTEARQLGWSLSDNKENLIYTL